MSGGALFAVVTFAFVAGATLPKARAAHVSFVAVGLVGMKIDGHTDDVGVRHCRTPFAISLKAGTDPNSRANTSLIGATGANYGRGGHQGENRGRRGAWAPRLDRGPGCFAGGVPSPAATTVRGFEGPRHER